MNKKTFAVAFAAFCLTLGIFAWFLYSKLIGGMGVTWFDWTWVVACMGATGAMSYNEFTKKKRRHREDVERERREKAKGKKK